MTVIKNYNVPLDRGYFSLYEFDLSDNYFVYFGNDPVALNRIATLPESVLKVFEAKKAELADIKFLEDKD